MHFTSSCLQKKLFLLTRADELDVSDVSRSDLVQLRDAEMDLLSAYSW